VTSSGSFSSESQIRIGGSRMHEQAMRTPVDTYPEPRTTSTRRFLTVSESAALLRVDEATVTRAIRAGEFPAVKIRRRYVIPAAAIERLGDEAITSGRCIDVANWTSNWAVEKDSPLPPWAR
jgi:excisionase family DNA binding protein